MQVTCKKCHSKEKAVQWKAANPDKIKQYKKRYDEREEKLAGLTMLEDACKCGHGGKVNGILLKEFIVARDAETARLWSLLLPRGTVEPKVVERPPAKQPSRFSLPIDIAISIDGAEKQVVHFVLDLEGVVHAAGAARTHGAAKK
jgi:hypothetical protein